MVASRSEGGNNEGDSAATVRRPSRWSARKIAAAIGLSLLLLLLLALIAIWIARRPIASNILEREFERRGVDATYQIERVGLRTQVIRNLVIGDPEDPDLVARYAMIQLRPQWDGTVQVYRIVARGVRLEGRLLPNGQVSWGQVDKLLPPPSGKPFRFPDVVLDIADASISLRTPSGPIGFSVAGSGNLTGGFSGRLAAASPGLDFGRCSLEELHSLVNIRIVARRPSVEGPVAADSLACPASGFVLDQPRLAIDSEFSEAFESFDGSGRLNAERLIAGVNGLAMLTSNLTFEGTPSDARGEFEVAARQSRLGPVFAERTRVEGSYKIDTSAGTLSMLGDFAAESATLESGMLAGVTRPLSGLDETPLGPIATAISNAIRRSADSFDATGELVVVNAPAGGAARIDSAAVVTATGARVRVGGADGITYYWPSGNFRVDTRIETRGGGLPTGEIVLRQPRAGAPLSGVARFQPYRVGDTRLAMQPIEFEATTGGATEFSTFVQLSGPFPDGSVRDLRLPVNGRFGSAGGFQIGRGCIVASFDFLRFRDLRLDATRLPICPAGQPAIVMQAPGGGMTLGARVDDPEIQGRLGDSPLSITADGARISDKDFTFTAATMRLGDPESPFVFSPDRLQGTFSGSGISGTFSGAEAVIGEVPLLISEADAEWRFYGGDLIIDDDLMLSDRAEQPRFYPLHSDDFHLLMRGDDIHATGTLRHPATGTRVTDVTILHNLDSGAGHAVLDVPGITFGEGLQPEELTRLTEGVVALVEGTVRGQGRINWDGDGAVTSTGTFTTVGMDLAAPFGPVKDLTTTVRFTDLLGLETAPGQVATVGSINPGILVENGVITYQLLPNQLVKIERGVWPFMGGWLVLQETVLNFGRPSAKRLTFEVIGLDASVFVASLGFEQLQATGTFDGVLPMIFDESGGRIVGGRLESRPPGGTLSYTGEIGDAGLFAELAFDALKHLRYRDMVVRLDGDLAGEFATRITIDQIALGDSTTASILRTLTKDLRFKFNITITGPFRSIIQTIRSLDDPTRVIAPVMPLPLDSPGIVTETRRIEEQSERTQTPVDQEVDISTQPPPESER